MEQILLFRPTKFLANSEQELTFRFAICCRPSVCLSVCLSVACLSVTLVHPTQSVVIFGKFSAAFGTLAVPSIDMHRKFYGDRLSGTSPLEELNPRGIAKYSDFGLIFIENYISETAQYRR